MAMEMEIEPEGRKEMCYVRSTVIASSSSMTTSS